MNKRIVFALLILTMFLSVSSAFADTWCVYTENGKPLNIRAKPNKNGNIITKLSNGTEVDVMEIIEDGAWAHISFGGRTGYCQLSFLRQGGMRVNQALAYTVFYDADRFTLSGDEKTDTFMWKGNTAELPLCYLTVSSVSSMTVKEVMDGLVLQSGLDVDENALYETELDGREALGFTYAPGTAAGNRITQYVCCPLTERRVLLVECGLYVGAEDEPGALLRDMMDSIVMSTDFAGAAGSVDFADSSSSLDLGSKKSNPWRGDGMVTHTETVFTNNIEMKYACFGSGEKNLVILPGLSLKSVVDQAPAVENAYRRFMDEYTVYLFDRRSNVEKGYTLKNMADDTAEVMRHLGIAKADIFGASQGGMIAMYLAVHHPELVNRMVLGSTTARISDGFRHVYKNWIALAKKQNKEELAAAFADSVYAEKTLELFGDAVIRDLSGCSDHELAHFVILAEALDTLSIYDDLSKIQCKTLVLGSEGDRVVGADAQRDIAAQLGCELHMYEPVYGHAVYDEAPDYLDRMAAFFTAHDQ